MKFFFINKVLAFVFVDGESGHKLADLAYKEISFLHVLVDLLTTVFSFPLISKSAEGTLYNLLLFLILQI